jgi:drug/metabolite transporter, DME family
MPNHTNPTDTLAGPLLILGAAFLWGTSGTVQAIAPSASTPLHVALIRLVLGGAFLVAAGLLRRRFSAPRKFLRPVFLLSGFTQTIFNLTYFTGIALTGVAAGSLLAIGSAPVFTGLLGIVLNGERPQPRWYISSLTAICGVILLAGGSGEVYIQPLGLFFALLGGFSYSFYAFLSGRMVRTYPPDAVNGISFIIAALMLIPFFFIPFFGGADMQWMGRIGGLGVVIYLGFFSSGIAYFLFGRGVRLVSTSTVGPLVLAEPLTASLLGIFFIREPVSVSSLTGMALIFSAQVLIFTVPKKKL